MWRFSVLVLLLPVVLAGLLPDASLDSQWEEWKTTYNKQYESEDEELTRRLNWEKRLQEVNTHNQEHAEGKHSYTMAMNQFADMATEELKRVKKLKTLTPSSSFWRMRKSKWRTPVTTDKRATSQV
ncbi:cathepsin K-like [Rhinatrema bivittatum]|uniref:cathepsin K-like n=1 Tax=Rhinatrema bivittatum TaxID=194408 RepID=UPI0011299CB7|nr:cathepsin K-like [Rhinatrema bivittatum]XP_029437302.1 cathepsin K-like [Rhinatrema bivittatum]XP_029437303.1 cathepsin K-like [Rhinatrema bivittatum]XP_029437304.1 cathepsin K-like [Rhinatrema bivittatum]